MTAKQKYCEDCGCKVYNGACTNCHEEIYIEKQYYDLGEVCPQSIYDKANEQRIEIEVAKRKVMN